MCWEGDLGKVAGSSASCSQLFLDAGDSARPRFTSLCLRWQVLDCCSCCSMAWEVAVGHNEQRLAVQGFLEVASITAQFFSDALRRRFRAGADDLHDIVVGWLAGIPATTRCGLGQGDRFLGRLDHRFGCRGWSRLGDRCWRRLGHRYGWRRGWSRRSHWRWTRWHANRRRSGGHGRWLGNATIDCWHTTVVAFCDTAGRFSQRAAHNRL